eukprot:CAMPEP_0114369954 /NCGR_PEP_ID=MMETSP0101-20121206/32095_1 /TAXON_ID=38822 ORGANISM="Pteridomonas danica, Strain PT" /NCGR_SAMPLE_ID=MMETSP0101 /ASSEMBLY_ACC=CAM_ASM_000211 /LENGTH=656 /DNA_ID=CAMNT_0001521137 /DNA_START=116 /DNA_END=2086 /DNA_ORIENTATION=-
MDFGSAQGTFVKGTKLEANQPCVLVNGDQVRFGQSTRIYIMNNLETKQEEGETEIMRSQLPSGFGVKKTAGGGNQNQDARSKREAEIAAMTLSMRTPILDTRKRSSEDQLEETNTEETTNPLKEQSNDKKKLSIQNEEKISDEERVRQEGLPVSHEVTLMGHDKAVLALALDPAGGRVIAAGLDQKALFWDFGGMDKGHRAFREIEPQSGYSVVALSFSPTGDRFLCCPTSVHPAIFTREGSELIRFVRGDMYLADSIHTKGHTHPVTGGCWHPLEKDQVLTCSSDATLRIWDLNGPTALEGRLICQDIYKVKNQRGTRVGATTCCYEPDGEMIAGGGADGSVQLWKIGRGAGASGRPDVVMRTAHGGNEVTGMAYSSNGRMLATRGDDDTVKVWDVRRTATPLRVYSDCPSLFATSNVAWSPDNKVVCCGTSVRKGTGVGSVKFFNVDQDDGPLYDVGLVEGGSVISVAWHRELNQIVCGTSTGAVKLLYDPLLSRNGALLSSSRTVRRSFMSMAKVDSGMAVGDVIINPCALPMYQDENYRKRPRGEDPVRPGDLRRPDKGPTSGPEAASTAIPPSRKQFQEQYLNGRIKKHNLRDQDSRDELIKYADKVKDSQYTGNAYAHNKGYDKLATKTLEQEKDDAEKEEKRKIGLGIQ